MQEALHGLAHLCGDEIKELVPKNGVCLAVKIDKLNKNTDKILIGKVEHPAPYLFRGYL